MDLTQLDKNLYALATSKNLNKALHHRIVPLGLFTEDGKEACAPMVLGSADIELEIETNAYKDTKEKLGDVPLKDQGIYADPNDISIKTYSSWTKLFNINQAIYTVLYCVRKPGALLEQLFEEKDQVSSTFDKISLEKLMDHYWVVKYTSPDYVMVNDQEDKALWFQSIIDKIKKYGLESSFFLNSLTIQSRNELEIYLVSQLNTSNPGTGTSGTPSDNTTTT